MHLSRSGSPPASILAVGALARPAALLLTLWLGACGTAAPPTQSASWYATQGVGAATAAVPVAGARPLVEIEGDGLEGQRAPRRRAEQAPDDPSEPYSPNYGSAPPAAEAPAGAPA